MDDGLILNFDLGDVAPAKVAQGKKGGRWTDRLKAKRVAKRKTRTDAPAPSRSDATVSVTDVRPAKRPRKEHGPDEHDQERLGLPTTTAPSSRPPHQVISSLFTSNPKIEQPLPRSLPSTHVKPSNAPLDSSTFTGSGLDPLIVAHLSSKMNISRPTSIQRAVLPALLPTLEDPAARDVFIQSQTGSGKTLSFLLPILQDLLPLSSHSYIDRAIGTLAIIIAPTRELAKQISDVLEVLLKLRLRAQDEAAEESAAPRLTRWLVSGLLTGGENRSHEKARLRKGVPILVSTPGRLLDHLQNTSSFDVGKCRWLVLDEADRLMELGFEETIQGILKGLDGRRKLAVKAVDEGKSMDVGGWDWSRRRRTVLCSATIREDVQKLAGQTLTNPMMIKAMHADDPLQDAQGDAVAAGASSQNFTPPSQLSQKYVVVPLKLRLVTLVALLRSLLGQSQSRKGTKIIVFLTCTDSVDFHWHLLGGTTMDEDAPEPSSSEAEYEDDSDKDYGSEAEGSKPSKRTKKKTPSSERVEVKSALLPDASIYRLHGSLPTQTRLASLKGFSAVPTAKTPNAPASSILLCTSVASRGLDLPLVRAVIQYDLPTESGATEYVHRVGRTARAGKGGEAWSFVAPSESEWVKWVQTKMQGDVKELDKKDAEGSVALDGVSMETVLRKGFGGKGGEYEERATEVQLSFERWVLRDKQNAEIARKAFSSHMRAYATHPSDEKHMFHIRHLHLGHLAKAFALREAPTALRSSKGSKTKGKQKVAASHASSDRKSKRRHTRDADDDSAEEQGVADAEKRMEKVVRAQGRLTKKGGKMVSSGTDEFQLAGGYDLENVVGSRT